MAFAYHRSLGPMIGVLLAIAVTEMLVVHLVFAAVFGWIAALVVGVIDLKPPIVSRRGRRIDAVAHKLDDPAAFHAAIAALSRRDGH